MDRTSPAYHNYYYLYMHMRRRRLKVIYYCLLCVFFWKRSRQRSIWVQPYNLRRQRLGFHHNLFLELRIENPEKYRRCMRMTAEMFDWLTEKVSPHIQKKDTNMRLSISPAERLSVTLRHLATGETQESLALTYRMGQSTISGIIKETCKAIYVALKDTYLKFPESEEDWRAVALDYESRWNFPNCLGAIDGKHVRIDPPLRSGSLYHNYHGHFSIVLMAVVDAQLRFIYVDVGANGKASDRGIWGRSTLKAALDNNVLHVPPPQAPPGIEDALPFTLVGDEGFTISKKMMIPYPKEQLRFRDDRRIFNYRLSRARRCSENAFGVMANRFQIFRSPMRYDPDDARSIVLAILCLHNMLRTDSVGTMMYTQPELLDREDVLNGVILRGDHHNFEPQGLLPVGIQGGNRHADDALTLRHRWTQYFNGPGAVAWQDQMIRPEVH